MLGKNSIKKLEDKVEEISLRQSKKKKKKEKEKDRERKKGRRWKARKRKTFRSPGA